MSWERKAAKAILRCLRNKHVAYETRQYYSWLLSPKGYPMQLDIYLPQFGVAIELDGRQHAYFDPGLYRHRAEFAEQIARDRRKTQILTGRGIALVRVTGKTLGKLARLNRSMEDWNWKILLEHLPIFDRLATVRHNASVVARILNCLAFGETKPCDTGLLATRGISITLPK